MIFKILIQKSLKRLIVLKKKVFGKIEKTVKVFKNDQKMLKFEFFNSKFEILVIFEPFNPLAIFLALISLNHSFL